MIVGAVDAVKALDLQCIGLCGVSGSGKDTIYEQVLEKIGFIRMGFSLPFKIAVVASGQATFEEVFYTKPPRVRTLLQEIGESHRQQVDLDIWSNMFLTWVRIMNKVMKLRITKIAVIDVRHPNEIACLKAIGGKILHLEPASKSLLGDQAQHISDTAFPAALPL